MQMSSHLDQTLSLKTQAGQRCYLPFPRVPISLSSLSCRIHQNYPSVSLEKRDLISSPPWQKKTTYQEQPQTKTFSWFSARCYPKFLHPPVSLSFNTHCTSIMPCGRSIGSHQSTHHLGTQPQEGVRVLHSQALVQYASMVTGLHTLPQPCFTCPVRLSLQPAART